MTDARGSMGNSRKTKLALSRLENPAVLPSVLTQAVTIVTQKQFSSEELVDLVAVSPNLAVQILRLASQHQIDPAMSRYSLSHLMAKLPLDALRNAVLDLPAYESSHHSGISDTYETVTRSDLIKHSVSVACCAKSLARLMVVGTDTNLAYLCGLLHDLGKLAIHELMPKGFSAMVGQARTQQIALYPVERCYLSVDHSVIGKFLARKWQLPQAIQMAIWLHHSHVAAQVSYPSYAQMAAIVYSANALVKSADICKSGSHDLVCPFDQISSMLKVSEQSLRDLHDSLKIQVNPVFERLHLDMADTTSRLGKISRSAAASLGHQNSDLAKEVRRLEGVETQMRFIAEVMDGLNPQASVYDSAVMFAKCWQRCFQTGKICVVWGDHNQCDEYEAVLIDELHVSRNVMLEAEGEALTLLTGHEVVPVESRFDWIFDQLDCEFPKSRCFTATFVSNESVQAVIIFEMNYPVSPNKLNSTFSQAVQMGSVVLGSALMCEQQEAFAEEFLGFDHIEPVSTGPVQSRGLELINALAEMAAGFAHELNNPLSIIAGRAQLMGENESEEDKKKSLMQIRENVGDISDMLEALIGFAEPPMPKPAHIPVAQLIEEAVQLAGYKSGHDDLDVSVDCADDVVSVFVDSGQTVSALANILVNSVESYRGTIGPIQVVVRSAGADYADIVVCDQGCGMDEDTAQKATTPFFSAKPAGRQRGMGLAYAARVIQVNQGRLAIQSRLGQGTEVLISLPRT